jgi:hypothetical protein
MVALHPSPEGFLPTLLEWQERNNPFGCAMNQRDFIWVEYESESHCSITVAGTINVPAFSNSRVISIVLPTIAGKPIRFDLVRQRNSLSFSPINNVRFNKFA